MSTLGEINGTIQNMLWSGAAPASWSTILWSVLGLGVGCVSILIGMAVNMHYRLKRAFSTQARPGHFGRPAASTDALPRVIDATVTLSTIANPQSTPIAGLDIGGPAIGQPRSRLQG